MAQRLREEGIKEGMKMGMKKGAQRKIAQLFKYLESGHSIEEAKKKFA